MTLFQSDDIGRTDTDTFPAPGAGVCVDCGCGRVADYRCKDDGIRFAGLTAGATEDALTGQAAGFNLSNSVG